jgi:hypothetical protein
MKALIYMGLQAPQAIYQQSYPQKSWMLGKSFMNQRLKALFASSPELCSDVPALA